MSDLVIDIQDMIEQNIFSYGEIARIMKVDLAWVYELARSMQDSSNFAYDD
jgi:predicted XRE-type DNA-binding protein